MTKCTVHWTKDNELIVITPVSRWVLMMKAMSMGHFVFRPAAPHMIPLAELTRQEHEYLQLIPIKWTSTEMHRTIEAYGWMLDDPLSKKKREWFDPKEFADLTIMVDYDTPLVAIPRLKEDNNAGPSIPES